MKSERMKPALLICGHGPGIGHSVARRFGRAGHPLHLVARREDRLDAAVAALRQEGIAATAHACDLADAAARQSLLAGLAGERIGILHWNAFMDVEGDLLDADPEALAASLNLRVVAYLSAVQTLLPRLAAERGAVLATSGVMALDDAAINALAGGYGILAVSVAAQHKANALLAQSLAAQGVYLGEVVAGFVQNTPGAEKRPDALNPDDIAQSFWDLYSARQAHSLLFRAAGRAA